MSNVSTFTKRSNIANNRAEEAVPAEHTAVAERLLTVPINPAELTECFTGLGIRELADFAAYMRRQSAACEEVARLTDRHADAARATLACVRGEVAGRQLAGGLRIAA